MVRAWEGRCEHYGGEGGGGWGWGERPVGQGKVVLCSASGVDLPWSVGAATFTLAPGTSLFRPHFYVVVGGENFSSR